MKILSIGVLLFLINIAVEANCYYSSDSWNFTPERKYTPIKNNLDKLSTKELMKEFSSATKFHHFDASKRDSKCKKLLNDELNRYEKEI